MVLGMHRSGTSALIGCLEECGVQLGHVNRESRDTPKGWCEDPTITLMHEDLLHCNGGTWSAPPRSVLWTYPHRLIQKTIIESHSKHDVWGFKDPRTLLTFQGWEDTLPEVEPIVIIRDPVRVAASLRRRNAMPIEAGLQLWYAYNRRALAIISEKKCPVLTFGYACASFVEQVCRLSTYMKFPHQRKEFQHYVRSQEPESASPEAVVPGAIVELYQELLSFHKDTMEALSRCS